MKKIMFALLALALVVGFASAAYLPDETPETQKITTITSVKCLGTVFESESALVASTSETGVGEAPLAKTEVQSLSSFTQDLLAGNGYTQYDKSVEVSTDNAVSNTYNVEASTVLEYTGNGAVFDESILEEGCSPGDGSKNNVMCPFGSDETAAAFCNRAIAGTNFMGDSVDLISSASTRNIAEDFKTPAQIEYGVTANGVGAFTVVFDAIDIDGRYVYGEKVKSPKPVVSCSSCSGSSYVDTKKPSAIMEYHERTTAIGQFDVTKIISYQSGL